MPAHVAWETVTPTGAAILRSVVDEFRPLPAMTVRATGEPFTGQVLGQLVPLPDGRFRVVANQQAADGYDPNYPEVTTIQSRWAEVVYWLGLDDKDGDGVRDRGENYILFRRVLLIRPDLVFDRNEYSTVAMLELKPRSELSIPVSNSGLESIAGSTGNSAT